MSYVTIHIGNKKNHKKQFIHVNCYIEHFLNLCVLIDNYTSEQTKMMWHSPEVCSRASSVQNLQAANSSNYGKDKISYHNYVDDTQIYARISPSDYGYRHSASKCIEQISEWMCQHFL